jgi:hypothetical protein
MKPDHSRGKGRCPRRLVAPPSKARAGAGRPTNGCRHKPICANAATTRYEYGQKLRTKMPLFARKGPAAPSHRKRVKRPQGWKQLPPPSATFGPANPDLRVKRVIEWPSTTMLSCCRNQRHESTAVDRHPRGRGPGLRRSALFPYA